MANESSWTETVDEKVNDVFEPVSEVLGDIVFYEVPVFGADFPIIVAWLVVAGLIFSVYFGFAQVRHIGKSLRLVRGKYDQPDAPGEVNHFQALTSAVSGTVGLGNIAGVAIAVSIGGPGATFWMIVCGLLGMASKFVECTLGVKYREFNEDGTVNGGPMLYLRKGLAERGMAGVGKVLAWCSAAMLLFFTLFGGNLFQVNQSLEQLVSVTGKDDSFFDTSGGAIFFGLLGAALVALVLIGGMRSIGAVTSRLVPSMAILYVLACLAVIGFNIGQVPDAFGAIFSGAFNPEGVAGGLLGALIIGFQRAAFSNEAGVGSAPIAHSAVRTKRPATEGLVAMIEPFVDTVIICTMTALTIIIADGGMYNDARDAVASGEGDGVSGTSVGISITSDAFETALPWFPQVLTVAVILFAFSTVITWGYYGLKSWGHIFGHSKTSELIYKVIFCSMIVTGALLSLGVLVDLADAVLFAAALFNIIGLYLLAPVVKRELEKVLEYIRRRDAGESDAEIEADEARQAEEHAGGTGAR
ncbi:alanine or glycine:cation symporter, AGCS family [Streptomyces zhaozhouensis]|uniref:Alanine or glycine:cation symporter, AGCS family n=1 Tax=Streptomyces zhaozhouensis TaxID=1300267 RepID=A0A286DZN3_9ACTN|nr:alanine/glycine:cation symporter family protein [Streptomyces zhaozhouensis]SOD64122.1 alanine or glycine:cation symporter, AGCS family [Streptomyces zhaozhouensis]